MQIFDKAAGYLSQRSGLFLNLNFLFSGVAKCSPKPIKQMMMMKGKLISLVIANNLKLNSTVSLFYQSGVKF
jgi:hypothetical protein